jgi:protein-tyrosine phosphatase
MGASEIEDGLYISDIHHVMEEDVEEMYDIIVTVCRNEPARPEDCDVSWQQFGLWDDDVSQQDEFDRAVQATIKAIETHDDADVLVHCIAGQSRSPAVVATALAYRDDLHFDEARDLVWKQRPQIAINPALREHGMAFLGQDDRPFTDG